MTTQRWWMVLVMWGAVLFSLFTVNRSITTVNRNLNTSNRVQMLQVCQSMEAADARGRCLNLLDEGIGAP